jgi:hypothetical protein
VGEAGIVARAETVKDTLGLGERLRLCEPEFDDQAILKGAKEPLHAALALRRGGGDPADAEFLERAPDLGRGEVALELLRQPLGSPRIAMKDAMPICIGRGGQAIAADELAQQQEIAVCILLGAKDASQDFARGIVDGREEDEAGAAVFEPGMVATVHLDEEAGLRHPLSATTMARWAAGAGTPDASPAKETVDGGAGQVQRVPLGQELGELAIVHAGVDGPGQGEDAGTDGLSDSLRGRAPAVAMRECGQAVLPGLGQ